LTYLDQSEVGAAIAIIPDHADRLSGALLIIRIPPNAGAMSA